MADLPVLSAMLSRLFESSQFLNDVALHHLIDALCKLSHEAMELAYCNRVSISQLTRLEFSELGLILSSPGNLMNCVSFIYHFTKVY